jgi:hypothetical protein
VYFPLLVFISEFSIWHKIFTLSKVVISIRSIVSIINIYIHT